MRRSTVLLVFAAAIWVTSCNRDRHRDEPAARQLGREAYRAQKEIKRGAKEAAQELRKAGKEIRKGWKEASREEAHRKDR